MGTSTDRDRLIDDIKILFQESYGVVDMLSDEGLLQLRKYWMLVANVILSEIEEGDPEYLKNRYAAERCRLDGAER